MGIQRKNGISWCDISWSPLVGCTKVSAGCDHCWAERMARLHYHSDFPNGWDGKILVFPDRLMQLNHIKKPARIAVGLMGDIFHTSVPRHFLDQIWATMGCCDSPDLRHLTFQILTKRPAEMLAYAKYRESSGMVFNLPNLWVGVTAENQAMADERIPLLLQTPAAVRFVSVEPMLGSVNIHRHLLSSYDKAAYNRQMTGNECCTDKLNWVICGGESGPGARPMHPDWARSLRDQCQAAGVPFHFKQWGEWMPAEIYPGGDLGGEMRNGTVEILHAPGNQEGYFRRGDALVRKVGKKAAGRLLDGKEWLEFPEVAR